MTTTREDLDRAVARMHKTYGTRRELEALEPLLDDSERVQQVVAARLNGRAGVAVLTDTRLFFYWRGLLREQVESLPRADVRGASLVKDANGCALLTEGAGFNSELSDIDEQDGAELLRALASASP